MVLGTFVGCEENSELTFAAENNMNCYWQWKTTPFFYKQHFYKQDRAEIGKKSSKS